MQHYSWSTRLYIALKRARRGDKQECKVYFHAFIFFLLHGWESDKGHWSGGLGGSVAHPSHLSSNCEVVCYPGFHFVPSPLLTFFSSFLFLLAATPWPLIRVCAFASPILSSRTNLTWKKRPRLKLSPHRNLRWGKTVCRERGREMAEGMERKRKEKANHILLCYIPNIFL